MGRLTVVRHGQASFLTDDYDRLSELGAAQCRKLGEFWAAHGVRIDRLAIGALRRHRQSAEAIAEGYAAGGGALPGIEVLPGLNEFPWDGIMQHAAEALLDAHPHLRPLNEAFAAAVEYADRRRTLQRYMEACTALWADEAFAHESIETFPAFAGRVQGAMETLTRGTDSGAHVVAVTSGGPAAVAVHRALDIAPAKVLELIWTLRNGALVEFIYTRGRFSLGSFNNAPHLTTPDLWTYR
jgi:broad specificity phosphatase PhoE